MYFVGNIPAESAGGMFTQAGAFIQKYKVLYSQGYMRSAYLY